MDRILAGAAKDLVCDVDCSVSLIDEQNFRACKHGSAALPVSQDYIFALRYRWGAPPPTAPPLPHPFGLALREQC